MLGAAFAGVDEPKVHDPFALVVSVRSASAVGAAGLHQDGERGLFVERGALQQFVKGIAHALPTNDEAGAS
jgi:hypothetical protein